jgi:putative oxidoreductase
MRALTDPLARILISTIFLLSGIMKLMHFNGTAGMLAQKAIPLPTVAAAIVILIELVGAIMIIIGWQTKLAAAVQFVYLVPVTVMYHNFWAAPPEMHDMQMVNFLKNVAIMGGLLILATRGAGASSVDSAASHG